MNESYCFTGDGKSWQGRFPSRKIAIAYAEHNNKPCIATARNTPSGPESVISVENDTSVEAANLALKAATDELERCANEIVRLEKECLALKAMVEEAPTKKLDKPAPEPFAEGTFGPFTSTPSPERKPRKKKGTKKA